MGQLTGSSRLECTVCHKVHRNVARLLGPMAPDAWLEVGVGERLEAELTPDICLLPCNGRIRHFLRGHLQLPVDDNDFGTFVWSAWVELSEVNMTAVARTWDDPDRERLQPLPGHLATALPYEQPTRGLPVLVHTRKPGEVPLLVVAATSHHRLAWEQLRGIAVHRAAELAGRIDG